MRPLPSILLLLVTSYSLAQNPQKKIESTIQTVTIFPEKAQVVRTANTTLASGKTDLIFQGLSPFTDFSSVQVEGEGKFVIVSVSPQPNKLKEQSQRKDVSDLEKSLENFNHILDRERALQSVNVEEERMLAANHQVSGANTDLKAADLKLAMDFLRARLSEIKLKTIDNNSRISKLEDTIWKISEQLKISNKVEEISTVDVVVSVDAKEPTTGNFSISYVVGNTGWYPSYDIRVDDLNKPLLLSYKANVFQNTGEVWKNVKVVFSNGNPTETNVAPVLNPLLLKNNNISYTTNTPRPVNPNIREVKGKVFDQKGEGLISAIVKVYGTSIGTMTDMDGNYSIKIPSNASQLQFSYVGMQTQLQNISSGNMNIRLSDNNVKLQEVVVSNSKLRVEDIKSQTAGVYQEDAGRGLIIRGSRDGGVGYYVDGIKTSSNVNYQEEKPLSINVRFELATTYTIINDGKTRAVEMKLEEIPASFQHFAVPKIEKKAFLLAYIANWEDYNLMDGEANLYYEGTYIGKTLLSLQDAEDTLQLSLGMDKGISISRTRIKDFSKKLILSDNKVASVGYEIVVRNTKKYPVKLLIEDQIPISADKEIVVDNAEIDGGEKEEQTGKVKWNFELGGSKEKKIKIAYSVKYPRAYRLQIE